MKKIVATFVLCVVCVGFGYSLGVQFGKTGTVTVGQYDELTKSYNQAIHNVLKDADQGTVFAAK
jgi:hypothetical protein